jgi:hypothetical protein
MKQLPDGGLAADLGQAFAPMLALTLALALAGGAQARPSSARAGATAPPPGRGVLYEPLSPQRWRVGFSGVGGFDRADVEARIWRQSAKIALRNGFDWIEPIGERTAPVESTAALDPQRPETQIGPPRLRLRWGALCDGAWSFTGDPAKLCDTTRAAAARAYQATTQVMMGHGPPPRNGLALAARAVLKTPPAAG